MSILTILDLAPVLVCLVGLMTQGCGQAPAGTEASNPVVTQDSNPLTLPADPLTVAPIVSKPLPPPPVGVSTFSLSYYRAAKTVAPVTGWPTKKYTAAGSCVVYNSHTYCWDDGLKTLTWTYNNFTYGPYQYSYFAIGFDSMNRLQHCDGGNPASGGCVVDGMLAPTIIAGALPLNIAAGSVNAVMGGVAVPVTCFEAAGKLECGDFTVDLNQAVIR